MSKNKSEDLTIYTDGGARGNPGPAGIGAVLFSGKTKKAEISKYIGHATNNVAEYLAVVYALQEALYLGTKKIVLKVDSQLVARQLRGEYKVKDVNLRKFFDIAINLLSKFADVEIIEIPRDKNKDADKLVNNALDRNVII
ncbi:MAG: ribonuclease HI family protein [Candidatus Omnitrophota bacterium]|nr:ribonuclease HI family protein [Candidatus Omnitrophota bacterium]MBU1894296.1 ribonuclease HI family protein [Candidatus Omnitrophota bacterium]